MVKSESSFWNDVYDTIHVLKGKYVCKYICRSTRSSWERHIANCQLRMHETVLMTSVVQAEYLIPQVQPTPAPSEATKAPRDFSTPWIHSLSPLILSFISSLIIGSAHGDPRHGAWCGWYREGKGESSLGTPAALWQPPRQGLFLFLYPLVPANIELGSQVGAAIWQHVVGDEHHAICPLNVFQDPIVPTGHFIFELSHLVLPRKVLLSPWPLFLLSAAVFRILELKELGLGIPIV